MSRRSAKSPEDKHLKSEAEDRNIFLTDEQCSCIVLFQPSNKCGEKQELYVTEQEIAAMDSVELDMGQTAAPDQFGRYLVHLAHLDLPLAAKIEMISTLRVIMASFVDGAFGDDPTQHVSGIHADDEKRIPTVVSSGHTSKNTASLSSAFVSPASGRRKKERS